MTPRRFWAPGRAVRRAGAVVATLGLVGTLMLVTVDVAHARSRSEATAAGDLSAAQLAPTAVPSAEGQGAADAVAPPTRVDANVPYGPLASQVLDVHLPLGGSGPFPVVVYVHGGGWIGGSRTEIPEIFGALVADTGVAVVSIDYRLVARSPGGTFTNAFPAASDDVDRAVRFVRANAARWNLDPDKIVLAGSSAGGQLAALAGVAPGRYQDPTLTAAERAVSPKVQGVIDYAGPSDFTTFAEAGGWAPPLTTALLDCVLSDVSTCSAGTAQAASIVPHLDADAPPAYLAYGEQDTLVVPATQGTPLALAWARARGASGSSAAAHDVWYEDEANADHNFDASNSNVAAMELWLRHVVSRAIES